MAVCIIAYYTKEYIGPASWSLSLPFVVCGGCGSQSKTFMEICVFLGL